MTKALPKLKGKVALIDNSWHRVFYRATQVERCVPCYKPIAVGMRVGVLENRDKFAGNPPSPLFYAATVEKIENGLITLKYENHPNAVSLIGGVKDLEVFCVPLKSAEPPMTAADYERGIARAAIESKLVSTNGVVVRFTKEALAAALHDMGVGAAMEAAQALTQGFGHSGHWDSTMQHGAGCLRCIEQRKLRAAWDAAIAKIEAAVSKEAREER